MLKLLITIAKSLCFALIVLILGNILEWKGSTVSEHLKAQLSRLEKPTWVEPLKEWVVQSAQTLTKDAKEGFERVSPGKRLAQTIGNTPKESIHPSEQEKLRKLIRNLHQE